MKLNALSRSFSNIVQNQKPSWPWGVGDGAWLNQGKPERPPAQYSTRLKNPRGVKTRPVLCVEDIKVSADKKYMYCEGCIRSQGPKSRSNVVVAVEWLDEDKKAVNTDWKRITMQPEGKTAALVANVLQSFIVRAPLDRRVRWVKAYAFAGTQ
jgi:hypothetical protein